MSWEYKNDDELRDDLTSIIISEINQKPGVEDDPDAGMARFRKIPYAKDYDIKNLNNGVDDRIRGGIITFENTPEEPSPIFCPKRTNEIPPEKYTQKERRNLIKRAEKKLKGIREDHITHFCQDCLEPDKFGNSAERQAEGYTDRPPAPPIGVKPVKWDSLPHLLRKVVKRRPWFEVGPSETWQYPKIS